MKATLTFSLPEDQEDFEYAQKGALYSFVLDDLDDWLRSKYKYENQTNIKIEEVRSKIVELLTERNLNK